MKLLLQTMVLSIRTRMFRKMTLTSRISTTTAKAGIVMFQLLLCWGLQEETWVCRLGPLRAAATPHYTCSAGLLEGADDPQEALKGFQEVVKMEEGQGEW